MALHVPPLQYHIDTDGDLEERLCTKGLKVVEIFSEWCGPCKSVIPTFKRIRLDKEDEATLLFLTICAESCKFLEEAEKRKGKSEPTFMLFRNGALKETIYGSNTPKLNDLIIQLTPAMAEADDLEENPLYQAKKEREKKEREVAKEAAKEAKKKK
mmetsp:Transcript_16973/g.47388  ORF Transcript_16973/g.47388 Transcript_16973/m.47388 type:complete len:156 (+) Transcript_16973:144-611(+)|eukprot:CAMPEP_0117671706 /NCGR_PEP_ID=MMETSP0804-20121206/13490_1 /TAXON_ID=1074897 /ORGANISM="Tetraselmis astigmatica, Strain CCMP880" /LENGTH=155 /DNA_ID=CAMNT_0005480211 /DNA_START=93 /DNA_END=560 /DNA_ORIENTATION=-